MDSRSLSINGRTKIGEQQSPYVIAEVGTNHNRDIETAKAMLRSLKECGVDCAKFQIYEADEIVSRNIRASDYKLDHIYGDISAYDMFDKHLRTPKSWFPELKDLCTSLGMDCAATLHGVKGIDWANETGLDFVKIASMDHTNLPFLQSLVNAIDVPIIASLGMARLEDIDRLADVLSAHKPGYALMHCSAVYPPTAEELRLSNIAFLINRYNAPIGFSDHTTGISDACRSLELGATFFEKHFTLDKHQAGPDHPFAMEPDELQAYMIALKKQMTRAHNTLNASADFIEPFGRELTNRSNYLKSIFINKNLDRDAILTEDDFYYARPATGIQPGEARTLVGKKLRHALSEDTMLAETDFA